LSHFEKICFACHAVVEDPAAFVCQKCGGVLGFRYDYSQVNWDDRFANSMWRYWRLLPISDPNKFVTLGEGGTPLLRSRLFSEQNVYLKDECRNPTGSHKDRALAVAINHAKVLGAPVSYVVSTGSTGISNAAFAARAGIESVAIMTMGTPAERAYPMFALGSHILEVDEEIDVLVDEVIRICRDRRLYLSSTSRGSNPYQSEGNKTVAFEVVESLGRAPDWMVIPVGGGGTISGIWRGFKDLYELKKIVSLPRLVGVVPRHYNALEVAFEQKLSSWDFVLELPYHNLPASMLVKLAHAYPPDGMEALLAVRESGGFFASVTDEEALEGLARIGQQEGLYVEASTSALLPVLDRMIASGNFEKNQTLVALMCGSGFRETFATKERVPLTKRTMNIEQLRTMLGQP
jgi:threonine synthase